MPKPKPETLDQQTLDSLKGLSLYKIWKERAQNTTWRGKLNKGMKPWIAHLESVDYRYMEQFLEVGMDKTEEALHATILEKLARPGAGRRDRNRSVQQDVASLSWEDIDTAIDRRQKKIRNSYLPRSSRNRRSHEKAIVVDLSGVSGKGIHKAGNILGTQDNIASSPPNIYGGSISGNASKVEKQSSQDDKGDLQDLPKNHKSLVGPRSNRSEDKVNENVEGSWICSGDTRRRRTQIDYREDSEDPLMRLTSFSSDFENSDDRSFFYDSSESDDQDLSKGSKRRCSGSSDLPIKKQKTSDKGNKKIVALPKKSSSETQILEASRSIERKAIAEVAALPHQTQKGSSGKLPTPTGTQITGPNSSASLKAETPPNSPGFADGLLAEFRILRNLIQKNSERTEKIEKEIAGLSEIQETVNEIKGIMKQLLDFCKG
ncbi:hypothetical protein ABW20_dc0102681 [Dactylellina cionopaga]|nr:hypothetical protein ABW20_dc0102681 [Dactylellina cionopaga]